VSKKDFKDCHGFIWCGCRGDNIPPAGLNEVSHFIIWSWIYEKDDRARCKYCNDFVKFFMPHKLPKNLKALYYNKINKGR
jgi:hypothetical protein